MYFSTFSSEAGPTANAWWAVYFLGCVASTQVASGSQANRDAGPQPWLDILAECRGADKTLSEPGPANVVIEDRGDLPRPSLRRVGKLGLLPFAVIVLMTLPVTALISCHQAANDALIPWKNKSSREILY
ncbi:hypothetical protein BV22DRAFT_1043243 [Leucogyrophana mollusca]|uniref:Uncharacterized protein n=1 Tax=Leucogyrophana mollusca TaxID=85980 RepID=A0ACB8BZF2_9AGAM|nr:hypothetical protein BV22DRAFT_1043243 [Leucogyrophana mollusca]